MAVDLSKWLLSDVPTYSNTKVEFLSPFDFLAELRTNIETMSAGDFVYLSCADLTLTMPFAVGVGTPNLQDVLSAAAKTNGVEVKVLLSASWPDKSRDAYAAKMTLAGSDIQCAIQNTMRFRGSNNRKFQILGRRDAVTGAYTLTAYCGGVDFTWDNACSQDFQARVEGAAAEGLLCEFEFVWNAERQDVVDLYTTDAVDLSTRMFDDPSASAPDEYRLNTQVLSTYPESSAGKNIYDRNLPPAQQIESSYVQAIGLAERLIYLEHRTMVAPSIIQALCKALEVQTKLEIVVVCSERIHDYAELFLSHLRSSIAQLQAVASDRVHVLTLQDDTPSMPAPLDIHSKLMIIDDIFVIVGSANLTQRSMSHDTELDIAMVDTSMATDDSEPDREVCVFARDLRVRLWGDYLDATDSELRGMSNGLATLKAKAGQSQIKLRPSDFAENAPKAWEENLWGSVDPR